MATEARFPEDEYRARWWALRRRCRRARDLDWSIFATGRSV